MKELGRDIVCMFDIIYVIPYTIILQLIKVIEKIIIHHINFVTKPLRIQTIFYQEFQFHIYNYCIILVIIRDN